MPLTAHTLNAAPASPHVVFILADDLGWADVGYHGSEVATPHLDRLAAEGVRLESHYAHPVCSPARAALLTGRYGFRLGVNTALPDDAQWGLPSEVVTLPETLRAAGYETALVGKWHLGHSLPEHLPTRQGFEHQYGGYGNPADYRTHRNQTGEVDWHRNDGPPLEEPGYATELQGREAVRRIRQRDRTRPLFLYLAFNAPHQPLQAPDEYLTRYPLLKGRRKTYAAMVSCLDDQVGRVREALKEAGMLENTILVFQSDNGGNLPYGASNLPLRGEKNTPFEGGARVTAFVRCPARWRPGVTQEPTHTIDWLPTLARECGAAVPTETDGLDLSGVLSGGVTPHTEGLLECHSPKWSVYRAGRWKAVKQGGWKLYDVNNELRPIKGRQDTLWRLQQRAEAVIAGDPTLPPPPITEQRDTAGR